MGKLADFLMRNSIKPGKPLPLVHTCQAYSLESIMKSGLIKAQWCDVFQEDLNYFFVGRPAYKAGHNADESQFWELPVCFVFQFDITDSKRIFPFDTGAFDKGMMPRFIQMMNRDDFEFGSVSQGPEKFIGTFFGTPAKYFKMEPVEESKLLSKYSLGVFDSEVQAVHRLVVRPGPKEGTRRIDDRRSAIEVQFAHDRVLQKKDLMAVVMPENYYLEPKVTSYFEKLGAEIISYPMLSLNPEMYHAIIYDRIAAYFRSQKLIQ